MNGTITISKNYHERNRSHMWGSRIEIGGKKLIHLGKYGGSIGYELSAVNAVEGNLSAVLIHLTDSKDTGVNLNVKLPQGVTLSDEYKTQVTTRYTADGTIATITFE
ncbi:hypothetical protein ABER23_33085 [Paenibacillus lautus]|uniref:hypothetical protein n=1 Tax=Paenibacillus lautus TaxID=1401 RepID=UPI003D2E6162